MKNRLIALLALMSLVFALTGCAKTEPEAPVDTKLQQTETTTPAEKEPVQKEEPAQKEEEAAPVVTVKPLPVTVDVEKLDNCTVAISLEEGDAYVDDTGIARMDVTVYVYDLYDMVDIARLEVGSRIELRGEEVEITALERTDRGAVLINGGLDNGGYELITDDSGVFFETGYSDAKAYYEIGKATVRISTELEFHDTADLDKGEVVYLAGDFLIHNSEIEYYFTPQNTSLVIEDGQAIAMYRVYTP